MMGSVRSPVSRWLRRGLLWCLVLGVLAAFVWTLYFLYRKSQAQPVVYKTIQAQTRDIVQKTVATGAIVPRKEVLIKTQVSGVLHKLHVSPGQLVQANALLAEIKILPNVVSVGAAEARVESAKISLRNAEREHTRMQGLLAEGLISHGEFNRAQLDLELARQELTAAHDNVALVKEGAIRGSRKISNEVRSTVAGMVIEVPVKEGATVIEANAFNEGTNIAAVADMGDLLFKGNVDESEIGKLREGMPVSIRVGALAELQFAGELEYLSPKGVAKEGTIEFEVRARFGLRPDVFVRANYSATADIILRRRDQVLALSENVLHFDENTLNSGAEGALQAPAVSQAATAARAEGVVPAAAAATAQPSVVASSGSASTSASSSSGPSANPANAGAGTASSVATVRRARVEVEIAPQVFESRWVELGLSDGLYSEILSGLTASERVKVPSEAAQP